MIFILMFVLQPRNIVIIKYIKYLPTKNIMIYFLLFTPFMHDYNVYYIAYFLNILCRYI